VRETTFAAIDIN